MIAEAERQTPETVRREYAETYLELRAGYTTVGEFHYLGLPEAHAAVEAAREAEIEIVLLLSAYARGGIERFRQNSTAEYFRQLEELRDAGVRVGCAPTPSAPARPTGSRRSAPMPSGSACHSTSTPTSSRARSTSASRSTASGRSSFGRTGCLGPRTTVVHATHADDSELDLLAETARASVSARRPREPRRRVRSGSGGCASGESASASARTRTSGSTRSRSCASRRRPPAGRRSAARSSLPGRFPLRRRRRRRGSRPRVVAGRRRRPGAPIAKGHRARRRPGRARPRLFCRGLRRELANAHGRFPPGSSAWSPGSGSSGVGRARP